MKKTTCWGTLVKLEWIFVAIEYKMDLINTIHLLNTLRCIYYYAQCVFIFYALCRSHDMEISSCIWSLGVWQIQWKGGCVTNELCTKPLWGSLCRDTELLRCVAEEKVTYASLAEKKNRWVKQRLKSTLHHLTAVTLASHTSSGSSSPGTVTVLNQ